MYRPSWIEPKAMLALGYELISDKDGYLKYQNVYGLKADDYGVMCKGKIIVYFNTVYYENITFDHEEGLFVGIMQDGDTRTVFNGVLWKEQTFKDILKAVR